MRKWIGVLATVAFMGAGAVGMTAVESSPAQAELKEFNGFDSDCTGDCPADAEDGDCCSVADPIIVVVE